MKKLLVLLSLVMLTSCAKNDADVIKNYVASEDFSVAVNKVIDNRIKKEQDAGRLAQENADKRVQDLAKNVKKMQDSDYVYGNKTAEYSMIVYTDLECPYCKMFAGTPEAVIKDNPNINLIVRHFPLDFHNPKATQEAIAAECVAVQSGSDGFYGFVNAVFKNTISNGKGLPKDFDDIKKYAQLNGAKDMKKFESCLGDEKILAKINQDIQDGQAIGISGTPATVVINNKTNKTKALFGALPKEEIIRQINGF